MARGGSYSLDKRQREAEKARRKQEKAEKRAQRRHREPGTEEVTTAEDVTGALPSVEEVMAAMERRAAAPAGAAPIPCRLFVGSLSWETTAEDLRKAFAAFGVVTDALVVTDRNTGRSRGFGFVTMQDRKHAAKAIEGMHESELNGRTIAVNVSTERSR